MIPAIIAPAFVLPGFGGLSSLGLWEDYDGSENGTFVNLAATGVPYGAIVDLYNDNTLGVLWGSDLGAGNDSGFQMFSVSSLTSLATLGSVETVTSRLLTGRVDFTGTDSRLWLPGGLADPTDEFELYLGEYTGSGSSGSQGPSSAVSDASPGGRVTDLDGSRCLVSIPGDPGTSGFRVGIGQRASGTLVSTLNVSGELGGTPATGSVAGEVRPLSSTRSVAAYLAGSGDPRTLEVIGIAHVSTTPSTTGSASTVDSNVDGLTGVVGMSRCLDGVGAATGRFILSWRDDTDGDLKAAIVKYDGSTLTVGSILDTGLAMVFASVTQVVDLGNGVAVLHDGGGDFVLLEYNGGDADDTSLALVSGGPHTVTLDGDAAGDNLNSWNVFKISVNRFGVVANNVSDSMAVLKVVHNGGDG